VVGPACENEERVAENETESGIQRAFRSNKLAGKSLRKRYGLDENEIAELPRSGSAGMPANPFNHRADFVTMSSSS